MECLLLLLLLLLGFAWLLGLLMLWELLKELLKALATERLLTGLKWCCRRKQQPVEQQFDMCYLIDMKTKMHSYGDCDALKKAKRKAKPIPVCSICKDRKELEDASAADMAAEN